MQFSFCKAQAVLTLLLVYCGTGATVNTVPILHSCDFFHNCEAYITARSWCQNTGNFPVVRSSKPQDSLEQLLLNISSASDEDNGVYRCYNCTNCCSAESRGVYIMFNLTVYGYAEVSPANAADAACQGQGCRVSYNTMQPNLEISNRIGYYPMQAVNKQGVRMGRWMVVANGVSQNIYDCKNFTCVESPVRSEFSIGTLTFMGEFGDAVSITDLKNLTSTLQLVYSIEAVPITSGSHCRYTAQRAVTYSFEVTSPSSSPSTTHSPSSSAAMSSPSIDSVVSSNPIGEMDIGTIAGIAASIVVVVLIVILLAVILVVCYGKSQLRHTEKVKSPSGVATTFSGNPVCSLTLENGKTPVEANDEIKRQHSVDSGHPHEGSEEMTSSGGEGEFILSLQQENEMEIPTKPTAGGDSISEESISLENFGEDQEAAL